MARAVLQQLDFTGIPPLNFGLEVVATLPATGLFVGRLVWNTATGAAYHYNGTEWKAWQIAGVVQAHNHAISDVSGLQADLDAKAAASHTHTSTAISDFVAAVDARVVSYFTSGAVNQQLDSIAEITTQFRRIKTR